MFPLLKHIHEKVEEEDNVMLGSLPNDVEIKNVVFNLSGDSSAGPDGLSGRFFQTC